MYSLVVTNTLLWNTGLIPLLIYFIYRLNHKFAHFVKSNICNFNQIYIKLNWINKYNLLHFQMSTFWPFLDIGGQIIYSIPIISNHMQIFHDELCQTLLYGMSKLRMNSIGNLTNGKETEEMHYLFIYSFVGCNYG